MNTFSEVFSVYVVIYNLYDCNNQFLINLYFFLQEIFHCRWGKDLFSDFGSILEMSRAGF